MHVIIYVYAECLTLGYLCDYNDNFIPAHGSTKCIFFINYCISLNADALLDFQVRQLQVSNIPTRLYF